MGNVFTRHRRGDEVDDHDEDSTERVRLDSVHIPEDGGERGDEDSDTAEKTCKHVRPKTILLPAKQHGTLTHQRGVRSSCKDVRSETIEEQTARRESEHDGTLWDLFDGDHL